MNAFEASQAKDEPFASRVFRAKLLGFGDGRFAAEHACNVGRGAAMIRLSNTAHKPRGAWPRGKVLAAEPVVLVVAAAMAGPRKVRDFIVLITSGREGIDRDF